MQCAIGLLPPTSQGRRGAEAGASERLCVSWLVSCPNATDSRQMQFFSIFFWRWILFALYYIGDFSLIKIHTVMAKIEHGILGGFSGKVGPVVGFCWRGRWSVRAYRAHIADPRTAAQLAQRSRFTAMIRAAQQLLPALRLGFAERGRRLALTEGNCFTSLSSAAFTVADGVVGVDYRRLVLAAGRRVLPAVAAARRTAEGGVEVVFDAAAGPRAAGSDAVCLVAYAPAEGACLVSAAARRSHGRASLALPGHWAGAEVWLYLFAVGKHGEASPSACLGTLGEVDAQYALGLAADAEAVVGPQAHHPYDAAGAVFEEPDPRFLQAAQVQVGQEVADEAALPHAEGVEAVAGPPGA